jgi:hypothetical protein
MSVLIALGVVVILGAMAGLVWAEERGVRRSRQPETASEQDEGAPDQELTGSQPDT